MRCIVFEPNTGGHRMTYVGLLLSALAEMLPTTLVTTDGATTTEEFSAQVGPLLERFHDRLSVDASAEPVPRGMLPSARSRLRSFRGAMQSTSEETRVFAPTADGLAQLAGLAVRLGRNPVPLGVSVEAALHRGSWAYPAAGWKRSIQVATSLALVRAAPFSVLHHVDVTSYEWLKTQGGPLGLRSRLLPDPVEFGDTREASDARRRLELPVGGRIVGCAGSMDTRKGMDLLVRAFKLAHDRGLLERDDRLLLVGKLKPAIRAIIEGECSDLTSTGRLLLIDRYVSNEELDDAICAMDVVCTPYPAHVGLSNIALRAAHAGRYVLGSGYGWQGLVIPRFGLGTLLESARNLHGFSAAIPVALDASESHAPSEASRELVRFHTPENFASAFTRDTRRSMGLADDDGLVPWPV
ncbi:MAG: glycosyltransferase [Planctomycetota bacterium]